MDRRWTERLDDELLGRQSAVTEARLLYRMIGPENTVEELRELIAVPQKIESILRAYEEFRAPCACL